MRILWYDIIILKKVHIQMKKTRIIAIEGIDGSGKGVQYRLLRDALLARGYTVETRDFPAYGSFFGQEIGKLLSGAEGTRADEVDGKSMALWFALDRMESFRDYRDGAADILILNRYVLSNAVYQSIRDIDLGKPDIADWVFDLEYNHLGLPRPDVNLVFSVAPAAAEANVGKKGYRDYVGTGRDVYESSHDIQSRAMAQYLAYAARYDDIAVIPCMAEDGLLPVETIGAAVLRALRERGIIE